MHVCFQKYPHLWFKYLIEYSSTLGASQLNGKESACNAGDTRDLGSIPVSGRSPGVGNGNLLQYSWTEESGGLQSMGHKQTDTIEGLSMRARSHTHTHTHTHTYTSTLRLLPIVLTGVLSEYITHQL